MSETILIWASTWLIHSTLLIAAVWLACRWIRSVSVHDTLWKIALLGALLTATVQTFAPLEALLPQAVPQRVTFEAPPAPLFDAPAAPMAAPTETPATSSDLPRLLFAGWAAVAQLLLARIAFGRDRFLAHVGPRSEILTGEDRDTLDALCDIARVRRPVRLTESATIGSPVAMLGWEIVVPSAVFARLSEGHRETILAHELGHLARRDPLWLTVAEVINAVLFFQPLNRLVRSRMKETAEFLCDDAAVLQTGNRRALAETLAELAGNITPATPAIAAMAEEGSNLIARVRRVLRADPAAPIRLSLRLAIALLVVGGMAAFAPGMVEPLRTVGGPLQAGPAAIVELVAGRDAKPEINDFADAELTRDFPGPEGEMNVHFAAHKVRAALDGSWFELTAPDGYLRAKLTSAEGPDREVEIVHDGVAMAQIYRVDGEAKAWCDDARRVAISAWAGEKAWEGMPRRGDRRQLRTWNANIETVGETDGVPTHIRIRIVDVRYDEETGNLELGATSRIDVMERVGERERSFDRTATQVHFRGNFQGTRDEDRRDWLRRLLRKQTEASDEVIDSVVWE